MEARFSLMQLFVSTALVAVGLAIWMRVVRVSGLFHWVLDFPICGRGRRRGCAGSIQAGGARCGDWAGPIGTLFGDDVVRVVSSVSLISAWDYEAEPIAHTLPSVNRRHRINLLRE
jgi:hypothetical protein